MFAGNYDSISEQRALLHISEVSTCSQQMMSRRSRSHNSKLCECCQLSINNKKLIYDVLFLWGGRRVSYFVNNFKNRANATYLFTTTLHIYLSMTNKPLAVTSSKVHSVTYEGQIETLGESTSFVLLLETIAQSTHYSGRKISSKKYTKKIKFTFAMYAVKDASFYVPT